MLVAGPAAPRPRQLHDHIFDVKHNGPLPHHREPFSFYWDERGPGDHLILSCASFRQGKVHGVEESVELLSGSVPKAQIEAIVTASNMKGGARGRLLIDIERVAVPFDGVFDIEKAAFKMRPPFEFTAEYDADDLTWFRNSDSEHVRI